MEEILNEKKENIQDKPEANNGIFCKATEFIIRK